MYTVPFYFHIAAIVLLLCLFLWITFLLLGNRHRMYSKLIKKLNPMILSLLFGIVLLKAVEGSYTYLVLKVILILVAVFLTAIGLRKKWKTIATLGMLLFVTASLAAIHAMVTGTQGQETTQSPKGYDATGEFAIEDILAANKNAAFQQGKVIYKVLCVECHGEEGQKEALANLAESKLTLEENMEAIAEGRGTMPGYSSQLSEQEINLVAAYAETLK